MTELDTHYSDDEPVKKTQQLCGKAGVQPTSSSVNLKPTWNVNYELIINLIGNFSRS
jgi:hypothetical protein